ncbi:hypothetical protein F4780DRAFT_761898 [Xylariomycetidae sp. FL0641]|nr:hypothetical protein F4780DRAFT_761898 [Xylariomycetidae sp. FL0641]
MAEVQARSQPSSRGRGGGRGGRGGFGGRNAAARRANGDNLAAFDDDGDISELRKQYGSKLDTIKELFQDWSDADILYALKETDGDVELTATRIAEGTISQWGEVSKPKKTTTRPKAKDTASSTGLAETSGNSRPARGGRLEGGRGARARGNERARGVGRGRGASQVATNGHKLKENQQLSVPTDESTSWANAVSGDSANDWSNAASTWNDASSTPTPAPAAGPAPTETTAKSTVVPSQGKTWASMLRQSTAPKPAPKPQEAPAPKPAESLEPLPAAEPVAPEPEPEPEPQVEETPEEPAEEPAPAPAPAVVEPPKAAEPAVALPPSDDDLTRRNLEQLPDESHPPETATVASTAADSWDPRQQLQQSATATPLSATQAQHQAGRSATSGYAASALKATERPAARMPSYQRRILEQEEAVRMPGNREVDRAAVQFGAFSLNGVEDDIDGDREDPETRTQPPAESPIAVPRASLPPVSQPAPQPAAAAVPDAFSAVQKPAASIPQAPSAGGNTALASQPMFNPADYGSATPVAPPTGPAAITGVQRMSQHPQPPHPTNFQTAPQAPASSQQYGRFPQANAPEPAGFPQKPYDTFGQQAVTTSAGAFDSFPAPSTQAPLPQTTMGLSSAASDYPAYYTADAHGRNAYGGAYYGQQYGQQHGAQSHHDMPTAPNRGFGGYGASQNDSLSQYPQSGAQASRYPAATAAEAHNSGHNTPNPVGQAQQTSAQSTQAQSALHQQPPTSNYPYGHPYYQSPYYSHYMNQFSGYGQGGYGAPYGKGSLYGQPHQYGMSPQGPFDHASSPAAGGFGQSSLAGRDSGLNSSMDSYGRAGSAQSGAPGGLGGSGFGMHDAFGRGSGYPSGPNAPSVSGAGNDDLKPYESKAAGGPSPSLASAARPGSTNNATPAGSGLPPPQSAQQGLGGYGGYPSHLGGHGLHGSQTAGSGYGLGASTQGHGSNPYGGYGGGQGYSNFYGGRQGQGGWGGNYH